jgi:hypothetical protein
MRILIIGILFLTSCVTYRNKPLTFITPQTISFNKIEALQMNKLKCNDTTVYEGNDSFYICQEYVYNKPIHMSFYKDVINEYYFLIKTW